MWPANQSASTLSSTARACHTLRMRRSVSSTTCNVVDSRSTIRTPAEAALVGTPSTDMDPCRAFEVPLAWLSAETTAEDFITAGEGTAWRGAFEFRATRDVLALTLFLAEGDCSSVDTPTNPLERLRDHLVTATGWLAWCRWRLDGPQTAMATPDISPATG